MGEWIAVNSSAISALRYQRHKLTIRFHNESVYEYNAVSQHVFDDFIAASSKGAYFHEVIRDKFRYKRIDYT